MLKDCLWNNPVALVEQKERLSKEGFDQAAEGVQARIEKLHHLFNRHGPDPKNTRPFEEPIDLR